MARLTTYTPDDIDRAFAVWCTEGAKNDAKTSELTGIPKSTLNQWRRFHGWEGRWLEAIGPEAEVAVTLAKSEIRFGLSAVVRDLIEIVTKRRRDQLTGELVPVEMTRDRIQAGKILLEHGFSLLDPVSLSPTFIDARTIVTPRNGAETPALLEGDAAIDAAAQVLEDNVARVNTRLNPSRRGAQRK